ncbi:MAG: hypothetical protein H6862_04865 [Rhodospirillales bacterium]|nr:hypothetical protein [Rhodospirillales bacterium]
MSELVCPQGAILKRREREGFYFLSPHLKAMLFSPKRRACDAVARFPPSGLHWQSLGPDFLCRYLRVSLCMVPFQRGRHLPQTGWLRPEGQPMKEGKYVFQKTPKQKTSGDEMEPFENISVCILCATIPQITIPETLSGGSEIVEEKIDGSFSLDLFRWTSI